MTAQVTGVSCAAGQYTKIWSNKTNVLVKLRSLGVARIVVVAPGAAAPNISTGDYLGMSSSVPFSGNFTDGATDGYLLPATNTNVAEVLAE